MSSLARDISYDMSVSAGTSTAAEKIELGHPRAIDQPHLCAEEGKVATSSNPDTSERVAKMEAPDSMVEYKGEKQHTPVILAPYQGPDDRTEMLASGTGGVSDQGSASRVPENSIEKVASHASRSNASDERDLGKVRSPYEGQATSQELTKERAEGQIDSRNANALLNLPPPLPFDLKVSNLWVGVPHRGPSS